MASYKLVATLSAPKLTAEDYLDQHALSSAALLWCGETYDVMWDLHSVVEDMSCYVTDASSPDAVIGLGIFHDLPLVVMEAPERPKQVGTAWIYVPGSRDPHWHMALLEQSAETAMRVARNLRRSPGTNMTHNWNTKKEES